MASETDGLTGEALREETTCSCGAGHGSGETHTEWCAYLTDSPAPIATPEEVAPAATKLVVAWLSDPETPAAVKAAMFTDDAARLVVRVDGLLASALSTLKEENERLSEAVEFIAEGRDVGRHDGLPEAGPAHDADTMFAVARAALSPTEPTKET